MEYITKNISQNRKYYQEGVDFLNSVTEELQKQFFSIKFEEKTKYIFNVTTTEIKIPLKTGISFDKFFDNGVILLYEIYFRDFNEGCLYADIKLTYHHTYGDIQSMNKHEFLKRLSIQLSNPQFDKYLLK